MSDNLYDHLHHSTTPFCSSYSEPTDDFSIFLTQILSKPSSSSSFVTSPQQQQPHPNSVSFNGVANVPAGHVSSSSVGTIDYDHDDYDCDSQEGFENLMEEMIVKPNNPRRNTTKRTRAAEVHNMSEKRRRSRINEKMKALQKLIPNSNSNKSDKASMLDEAIEYLKQLQLQVQALTMRNGINWYTMSASPSVPQPNQNYRPSSGSYQGIQSMSMTANQERIGNPMLNQSQQSILDFSRSMNQGSSFGTQLGLS